MSASFRSQSLEQLEGNCDTVTNTAAFSLQVHTYLKLKTIPRREWIRQGTARSPDPSILAPSPPALPPPP